jgi:hypothetical protein
VGPVYSGVVWPAKWSPNGARLAYFRDNALYWCDTLGISQKAGDVNGLPHSFEWLSDDEIVIRGKTVDSGGTRHYYLNRLFLNDHHQQSIFQSERARGELDPKPEGLSLMGPYRSSEGTVYYETVRPDGSRHAKIVLPSNGASSNQTKDLDSLHIYRASKDGVYHVRPKLGDSVRVSRYSTGGADVGSVSVDHSGAFMYVGGKLIQVATDSVVPLGALAGVKPAGTVHCGFVWGSFHPTQPYLLGVITCDDGEGEMVIDRMAVVNCRSLEVTFLEPLLGISD